MFNCSMETGNGDCAIQGSFKWNLGNPGNIFHGKGCQALDQSAGVESAPLALGAVVGGDHGGAAGRWLAWMTLKGFSNHNYSGIL